MSLSQPRSILTAGGLALLVCSLALALTLGRTNPRSPLPVRLNAESPKIILWAWERPTDLRFINPAKVGVALLARTISLRGAKVSVQPRLQPLNLPAHT